jgi:peptidoglycan/xylan/chitin deacetylase (PgdA/CDA1 family)
MKWRNARRPQAEPVRDEPRVTPGSAPPPVASQTCARVSWAGDESQKLIALTFDDGPVPNCSPMVYDVLDQLDVPATFYLVGQRLQENAELIAGGRLDRHEIGNHTWTHRDLSVMDFSTVQSELRRTHDLIVEMTGKTPTTMRPPFGHMGALAFRAASTFNYEIVLWGNGVTESEWQDKPGEVIPHLLEHTKPGTIFLIHDAVAPTNKPVFLERLGAYITGLRDLGYEFVTVSEMLGTSRSGS